ncbi:hypothetical protein [Gymnodinialimonas hymeniacidonis]|uniref:hypothetical protein n=1 Tax=Gymnodinialimonas hymeniacidonis TaxID=3126508 RepID=UPI0034C61EF6
MDTLVLYIGFAILAGMAAGYMTARLGTRRMVLALWSASALTIAAAILWSDAHGGNVDAILVVYGMLVPFAGCAIVAGALGLAVRSVVTRAGTE